VKKINGNSLPVFEIILLRQGLLLEVINNNNINNKENILTLLTLSLIGFISSVHFVNHVNFWRFLLIKSFSCNTNQLKNGIIIPKLG